MLNHLSLGVGDLRRSIAFYDSVFEPLGYRRLWTTADAAGYGSPGAEEPFAIKQEEPSSRLGSSPRSHIAITARSRSLVAAFHEAALRNGGTDRGAPGLRPAYGTHYFAAFVADPDGYHLEVVCHTSL